MGVFLHVGAYSKRALDYWKCLFHLILFQLSFLWGFFLHNFFLFFLLNDRWKIALVFGLGYFSLFVVQFLGNNFFFVEDFAWLFECPDDGFSGWKLHSELFGDLADWLSVFDNSLDEFASFFVGNDGVFLHLKYIISTANVST